MRGGCSVLIAAQCISTLASSVFSMKSGREGRLNTLHEAKADAERECVTVDKDDGFGGLYLTALHAYAFAKHRGYTFCLQPIVNLGQNIHSYSLPEVQAAIGFKTTKDCSECHAKSFPVEIPGMKPNEVNFNFLFCCFECKHVPAVLQCRDPPDYST